MKITGFSGCVQVLLVFFSFTYIKTLNGDKWVIKFGLDGMINIWT